MARTNKKKQRENKKSQSKTAIKFTNPRVKLGLQEAKDMGVVIAQENGSGGVYHWFVRGRKACYETKMKYDPDGWRFYKGQQGDRMMTQPPIPNWAKRRLKTRSKRM